MRRSVVALAGAALSVVFAFDATRAEAPGGTRAAPSFERTEERSACTAYYPLRRAFYGDTHVHTTFSFDAWGQGTLAGPRDAYRYARGEAIGIQPYDARGEPLGRARLRRPLDFAMVSDHSDLLGETRICKDASLEGSASLVCRVVRRFPRLGYLLVNGHTYSNEKPARYSFCGENGEVCLEAGREPWRVIQDAAEEFYDRSAACRFTTFVGYEWTAMPGGRNAHRNIVFRNEKAQAYPTTYIEDPTQEQLWAALERECLDAGTGCDAIAIPHNSNVSAGELFTNVERDGSPLTPETARRRARIETLVEVTQHKGDSECRVSAQDELCAFETLDYSTMQEAAFSSGEAIPPLVYAREVLTEGLVQDRRIGVNPFAFGLIGATDTHLAAPGMVDEDEYRGHAAGTMDSRFGPAPFPDYESYNPGGLAGVWAEENSRDSLFEAMRRREAFGTSGPRMSVRLFGGWEYPDSLCEQADFAAEGYAGGVPMGGTLEGPPLEGPGVPRFAVRAWRDPGGGGVPSTPLQRIQIVKGAVDPATGETRETVFDVAGDAGREADVDLRTCTPRGPGFDELCTVWSDPDFDPAAHAYYYARVVENPSCRWNQWACNAQGVDCEAGGVPRALRQCCDPEIPKTIQERAWSSPIWYRPQAGGAAASSPRP